MLWIFSSKCYFRCIHMFWSVVYLLVLNSVYFMIFTFISSVRLMAGLEYFKVSRYMRRVKIPVTFYLENSFSRNPRGLFPHPLQTFAPCSSSQELVYIPLNWILHQYVVILFIASNKKVLKSILSILLISIWWISFHPFTLNSSLPYVLAMPGLNSISQGIYF